MRREIGPQGNVVIYDLPKSETGADAYTPEPYKFDEPPGPLRRGPVLFVVLLVLVLAGAGVMLYLSYTNSSDAVMSQDELNARLEEASARSGAASSQQDGAAGAGATSRSVSVDVESRPEGAAVLVDYDSVGTTPLRNHRLNEGVYILSILFGEGERLDTVVVLEESTSRTFSFVDATAGEFSPFDAEISGEPLPDAPPVRESQPLTTSNERQTPPSRDDDDTAGRAPAEDDQQTRTASEPVRPQPSAGRVAAPAPGRLQITSEPAGAAVVIAGRYRGRTPLTLPDVEPGRYEVGVQLEGYAMQRAVLVVTPRETTRSNHALEAQMGTLNVLVEPWGSIYIDGELRARDTDVRYSTSLNVGTYQLTAEHPVLGRQTVTVTVHADQVSDVVVNLASGGSN